MGVVPVETDDQWHVVEWLWQAFRTDMSRIVGGLPRADGRFSTRFLMPLDSTDHAGFLWTEENEHGVVPGGFAVVGGLEGERRTIDGFWVAHPLRRTGVGRVLALDVIGRYPDPWTIAFQDGNSAATPFWRQVADAAFGASGWTETERAVPGRPEAPPDHWIETT